MKILVYIFFQKLNRFFHKFRSKFPRRDFLQFNYRRLLLITISLCAFYSHSITSIVKEIFEIDKQATQIGGLNRIDFFLHGE